LIPTADDLIEEFQLQNVTSRFAMEWIKCTIALRVPEMAT
jgi:hypothetical protein